MSDRKRVLRIHVSHDTKDDKVNITLPLGLARLAKLGGIAEQLEKKHHIDLDEILDDLDETPDGKIIDVIDEKSGDHIEIYVETRGAKPEPEKVGA